LISDTEPRIKRRMNILLIGSGGREHALAWKMAQSPLVDVVHSTPGNPGMDEVGPCFDVGAADIENLEKLTLQIEPDLIVIGPEAPLAAGLADLLRARGFDVFGPGRDAAQLEASKSFSKGRMTAYGVPTAAYGEFTEAGLAKAFLRKMQAPYVLKADGLAAGKGVTVAMTLEEATRRWTTVSRARSARRPRKWWSRSSCDGEEASFFCICDGTTALPLTAQDHKRVGDGDTGPNTGGMGAYSPASIMTDALIAATMERSPSRPCAAWRRTGHAVHRRALCRADADRRRAEADRIQCPFRRSGMPGDHAAAEGRPCPAARLNRRPDGVLPSNGRLELAASRRPRPS
jgi:phosphoribosylamine--glycine ligase